MTSLKNKPMPFYLALQQLAEQHFTGRHSAEYFNMKVHLDKPHSAACHRAECRGTLYFSNSLKLNFKMRTKDVK
jgi:hypothetical protein